MIMKSMNYFKVFDSIDLVNNKVLIEEDMN